jgi:aminoglycoside phosphotransferase (APT) family kinase protein
VGISRVGEGEGPVHNHSIETFRVNKVMAFRTRVRCAPTVELVSGRDLWALLVAMSENPLVLAEQLLGALHGRVGRADVTFAELPVRLGGGFFAENHAFRLAGVSPPWDGPLVVRLFPSSAPPELAFREAAVQTVLADQGYPAARVVLFEEEARLLSRRFFVMERLPGRPMMGGIRIGELARSGWRLFTRLADVTATLQAWLHRLDARPLLAELGDTPAGIERWFVTLETQVNEGADGLSDGLQWLIDHRPASPVRASICHGDLWGGNVLTQDGHVTGVLDWTVATVADPALDVGFTAMSLCLAPIDAPRPIQRAAARLGRSMCRRYIRAYQGETGADLSAQPYYEALRCAAELAGVVAYRLAEAKGKPHDFPRFTWDSISDQMVDYFRERTGVTLEVPPVAAR